MKEAIAAILQTRMDKCTGEQFWATGAVAALNAYLLSQADSLSKRLGTWPILVVAIAVAAYGAYFIIHRHIAFYSMLQEVVALLKDEPDIPPSFQVCPPTWKGHSLSGITFYSGVIVVSTLAVVIVYL